jgi:hypothetical protein
MAGRGTIQSLRQDGTIGKAIGGTDLHCAWLVVRGGVGESGWGSRVAPQTHTHSNAHPLNSH